MPPANYFEFGVDKIGNTMSTHALALDAVIKSDLHNIMLQSGSGASAVYIKTDNKVGIANSAPSEALDITGYVRATTGYKTGDYGVVIDTSGNFTGVKGTLTGDLLVDNDTLFVDSSNNNVGIGTITPGSAYKLHVVGDTRIQGNIIVNGTTTVVNTNVQNTERLEITNDGTGPAVIIRQTGAEQILKVLDGSNNCFIIEDNGHVLVGGAIDSTYHFDVSGNAHFINQVDISGNTDISGNLNVGGNAKVVGSLTCSSMNIDGNFGVAGDFDLSGNFRILTDKFVVTPSGNVAASGTLDTSGNFNVNTNKFTVAASSGNTAVAGTLAVTSDFNVSNKLNVQAEAGIVNITAQVLVNDNNFSVNNAGASTFTVDAATGDTLISGELSADGNFYIAEDKFTVDAATGNTGLAGTLDVSGNFAVNGDKFTANAETGDTTVAGTFTVGNDLFIVDSGSTNTEVNGELYANSNFYVATDKFTVNAETGETNVAGHFNVASDRFTVDFESGNTTVAGTLDVTDNFSVNADKFTVDSETGNTSTQGTLDVTSNFNVNTNKLTVDAATGDTVIAGELYVDNDVYIGDDKFIVHASSGNTEVAGTLEVVNDLKVATDKFTVASSSGNTGVAGTLDVSSNLHVNADKFTVDATNGNTGIAGTLDVSSNLNVNTNKFTVAASTGNTVVAGTLALAGNFAVDTDVLFVDVTSNKVGINDSTPSFELDVSGSIATNNAIMFNSGTDGAFGHRDNNNATSFALLQTSGGQTTINCKAGSGNIVFKHGDGTVKQEFDSSGNVIIQGNLFSYSDARIKTNVVTIPNALDKVLALRGVTYHMIKDIEIDPVNAIRHIGVIAQEVEAVIPEAVKEEHGIKTVAYGNIVGLLIEAIKDLKEQMKK